MDVYEGAVDGCCRMPYGMASTSSRREDTVTVLAITIAIALVLYSIILHEISHGFIAERLGAPTAKNAGRLTLNPLKHLDPVGSVLLPVLLILTTGTGLGWAKPVPVNPSNFRDQKYGSFKTALAGPAANLAIALVFGLIIRFSFELLPLVLIGMFSYIVFINVLLAVFNLMPIPPLDGSQMLFAFLPDALQNIKIFLSQFSFYILQGIRQ